VNSFSSEVVLSAHHLTKTYEIYKNPLDRLKEAFHPLRKKYHDSFTALSDVTFDVRKGETVGIVGRNGAGKSTLLKMLSGVLTPTSGSVTIRGRIASLLELGTGFNPELTGRENVYFNGMLLGISSEVMSSRISIILDFADIGPFIDRPVKMYSSGMFARLAFAVAFHVDPEILIVDEALSVGDITFQKKCYDKFKSIRESGCSILFVSHDAYQIKGYCQRALYLRNGGVVGFGQSSDIVDRYLFDQESLMTVSVPLESPSESISNKENSFSLRITSVDLLDESGESTRLLMTSKRYSIRFNYELLGSFTGKLSFVVNLYRHDDLYLCGATSLMDHVAPFTAYPRGEVTVTFDSLPLLSGQYKWRVAINDDTGLGIYTEAVPVCECKVTDEFQSVGVLHIGREWSVRAS
jgi:ABC-type polysaccharide/polyol phosphate transport system ATPase subunit